LLIVVHIGAPQGERFDGAAVLEALQGEGLVFGAMDIFHRMAEDGGEETLFSVANAVKPGTLVPHELPGLSTPGLSLFLRLPAPGEPMAVFEDLMSCAQGLADRLGGQLQDETRSAMTAQTEAHLRERVGEWGAKYG
jgi:cell division protein ZipA